MPPLLATELSGVWRRKQFRAGVRTALFEPSDLNNCPRSEDLSTWSKSTGTGSAVGGQPDPYGGTTAYKLDDTDAGVDVNWTSPNFAAYQASWTTRGFSFFVRADTAAVADIGIRDVTAAVYRARITVTPVAGVVTVGSVAFSVGTGRVVYVVPVTTQPGTYRVGVEVDNIVVANTHCFIVRPAGPTAASVGATNLFGFMAHHLGTPAHSYIPNNGAAGAISCPSDRMRIPWPIAPGPLSFYAKYYETGMQRNAIISGATVRAMQLGDTGNIDPRLILGMTSAGTFLVQHANAATGANVSSTAAAPTLVYGDLVELFGLLFGDGSVQVYGAVNGGVPVVGVRTGAKTLPAAWAADGLLASQEIAPWSAFSGFAEALALAVFPGQLTLDEARMAAR